jgi:hypothetical protein
MLRITEGNHFRGFAPHPPFIPRRRGRGLHRSALSPGDRRGVPAVQCTLVHVGAWHAVEQPTLETNKGARSLLEVNELVRDDHPQARTRLVERRCIGVLKVRAFSATNPHDHPPIGTIFDQIPNRIGGLAQGKDLTDLRLQRTLLQIPKDRLIS